MQKKEKILIVRVGRLGDMIMITPALSYLLEEYPNADFTLLTSLDGKRILKNFSTQIKNIWVYDRKKIWPFDDRKKIKKQINAENFSQIFCFETSKSYLKLIKNSALKIHLLREDKAEIPFARKLLNLVGDMMGKKLLDRSVAIPVTGQAKLNNQSLLNDNDVNSDSLLIAFHPTFSGIFSKAKVKKIGIHKIWPTENFAQLAILLNDYFDNLGIKNRILINLLPEEVPIGKEIEKLSNGIAKVVAPKPNIENYKAFLQSVDLLIVPDTGTMHLAASVGTPMVALFSGKSPDDCGPFYAKEKHIVLQAKNTEHSELGIAAIKPSIVFEATKKLLTDKINKYEHS